MTRILVVQFCRLGDILQTTPLLRGLRRKYPDAEIVLGVLDGFAHAPVPTHLYDRLAIFPFDGLGTAGDAPAPGWQTAARIVRSFVHSLGDAPFNLVLNLTGSPTANLLSAIVPSNRVEGGVIAPDRTRVVRGEWMIYFWSSLLARSQGAINLVDLFRLAGGVPADARGLEIAVAKTDEAFAAEWLATRGIADEPLIAVQLGASDERKRWSPESFAAMANLLPASTGRLLFVGANNERPLVEHAVARLDRTALNALGETTVPQLAALLARCRLLLTNDTGTMHVAAAVGTRIVDLSTGPVFVHETGPYAEGSLAIEPASGCFPCVAGAVCHHLSCREDFTPLDIAAVVQFALGTGPRPRPARARILRAARTVSGRLEYRPIWNPGTNDHDALRQAFGRMWDLTLPMPSCDPETAGADEREPLDERHAEARCAALSELTTLATRAATIARQIPVVVPAHQSQLSAELHRALEHAIRLGQLEPATQPIVGYLRTALESCTARDVADVARVYGREWSAAGHRAAILSELISPYVGPSFSSGKLPPTTRSTAL
jgi:ADP-heptose:LPS heptosyltransferase